jgi:uncharacterized membrane protein YkvA (DUF1232 family)
MATQEKDFYQKLRVKIEKWLDTKEGKTHQYSEYIMAVPDLFHLLTKLMFDKGISAKDKAKLGFAIAYFISPIDLIPEAIVGPIGFIDDLALAAWVLNNIINENNEEIVLKHWAGQGDILFLIKKIIADANEMIGIGLWNKIKALVDNKG